MSLPTERFGAHLEIHIGQTPPSEPVLVFHHIQKTAGTALTRVIRRELSPARAIDLSAPRASKGVEPSPETTDWFRAVHAALTPRERERILSVTGHGAPYVLPVLQRPCHLISVVREPVDRVLSRYYFSARNRDERRTSLSPPTSTRNMTLEEIYRRFAGTDPLPPGTRGPLQFFNGQSRTLLAPHYDTRTLARTAHPSTDADVWRERLWAVLSRYSFVGRTEDFQATILLLARSYGWQDTRPERAKVNRLRRGVDEHPASTLDLIRDHNWLDLELYERVAQTRTPEILSGPASCAGS